MCHQTKQVEDARIIEFLDQQFAYRERKRRFEEQRFFSAEIEMTSDCQLECSFCYNVFPHTEHRYLPLQKARELLNELALHEIKSLFWLGGEPLMHDNIFDILGYAQKLGIASTLFTNGTDLTASVCKDIRKYADFIIFHLDTVDPEIFARLQDRRPGAALQKHRERKSRQHSKIMSGLDSLIESGFDPSRIDLNLTVMQPVVSTARETMRWAIREKKLRRVNLIMFRLQGKGQRAFAGRQEWIPHKKSIEEIYKYRAELTGHDEWLAIGPSDFGKYYDLTTFYIDIEGRVKPGSCAVQSYGNVYKESLSEIIQKQYQSLSYSYCVDDSRNILDGSCGHCQYSPYCFGGRECAYWYGTGLRDSDPTCWLAEEKILIRDD